MSSESSGKHVLGRKKGPSLRRNAVGKLIYFSFSNGAASFENREVGIRFDVIEVTLGTRGTPDIVWHKGAFLAS